MKECSKHKPMKAAKKKSKKDREDLILSTLMKEGSNRRVSRKRINALLTK
jgi:hypothetical protein